MAHEAGEPLRTDHPMHPEPSAAPDPGSFRDRGSRVFEVGGEIRRALSSRALADYDAVSAAPFFSKALAAGRIVGTERADGVGGPLPLGGPWAAVLRHERIPIVSYPYEWTFGMLRDAALLQLQLLDEALAAGFIVKDASAYNVQWRGASPVFIDVGSFEPHEDGSPWIAYRQFCQLFLYPLFLQAYRGASFHPWRRGRVDGIPPEEFAALCSLRDLLRPGVLVHGWLHARMSARHAGGAGPGRGVHFTRAMIRANVHGLRRLVEQLTWDPGRSTWSDYAHANSYGDADRLEKDRFVRAALARRPRRLVWDLGSNTGTFSRMAAEVAENVLAIDADHLALERLYRSLHAAGDRRILPLLVDLADPSPGLGWRGLERRPLEGRGRPDMVLALALIHHLVLAANVPLAEVVSWFAGLGAELVIEFVEREDPMVRRLLAGRPDFPDYRRDHFERCVGARFETVAAVPLPGGTRVLYHLVPLT
jgi:hypothetical protein